MAKCADCGFLTWMREPARVAGIRLWDFGAPKDIPGSSPPPYVEVTTEQRRSHYRTDDLFCFEQVPAFHEEMEVADSAQDVLQRDRICERCWTSAKWDGLGNREIRPVRAVP
jgi:hypothetical protein